ncbi:MAG: hypothetical protein RLZZ385_2036 [Pseudomonadota bacterium]|jgi:hypothetical protein
MKKATQTLIERFCFHFLVLCIACYSPANFAQQPVLAGRVVAVSGSVTALDAAGQTRPLERRSEVFVGDTIITGPRGFTQIRMTDQAIVALKEATQFVIVDFSYQEQNQDDVATMRLIQGGFRTITGNIRGDDYNIETDFATIGIRGTDHEGTITEEGLYTGVYDGGTTVENDAASLDLGLGADYDYAQVQDPNLPPIGLTEQPTALGNIPVLNVDEQEDEDDGGDGDGDGNADGNGDGNADGGADGNADGNADGGADGNAGGGGGNTGGGGDTGGTGGTPGGTTGGGNPPAPPVPITLDNAFGSTGGGTTGGGTTGANPIGTQTDPITVNPNENTGDGTLDCALNSTNPACRPKPDASPTP